MKKYIGYIGLLLLFVALGFGITNVSISADNTIRPLYRIFSPVTRDHFLPTSFSQKSDMIIRFTYLDEGQIGYVLNDTRYLDKSFKTLPLFQLNNLRNGDRFFTTSEDEKYWAVKEHGYIFEGISGYVYANEYQGTTPLYRMYDKKSGDHFQTIDLAETYTASSKYGYIYEGITGYVNPIK